MAGEDKILKVLLQIQSDLEGINKLRSGVDDLKKGLDEAGKSAFSWGDAFKFAGAEEALHGVLEGVKKVGEEIIGVLEHSVEKAAELQSEAFPLNTLIGNASVAKQVLTDLDSLWQQFGVVSNEALANAARNLLILGTPAENVIVRLTELTKISVGVGVSLDDVVSAYQRIRFAIENGAEPMIRGMGGFGAATAEMLKLLEQHLGKTQSEVLSMFKAGQIGLNDLLQAFRQATQAGGSLVDVIDQKKNTFNGAVQAMKTAWEGIEVELGKPIIDTLTPVINRISEIEKAFAKIAQDEGWSTALRLAWEILIDEVAILWQTTLSATFTKIGPAFIAGWDAMWKTINEHFKSWSDLSNENLKKLGGLAGEAFTHAFVSSFGNTLGPELEQKKETLLEALNSVFKDLPKGPEGVSLDVLPPETAEKLGQVAKTGRDVATALKEAEGALEAIHQQQQLITQNPLLPVEEKDRLLVQQYALEAAKLTLEIQKLSMVKAGLTDPIQIREIDNEIQKLTFSYNLLGLKLVGLQQPLRADLANWVNSFGDSAHQIAATIEGSINAALQGTNQLLLDAAFRTGDWRQTLQGVERQILNLFLTWLEQMALQQAASLLGITTTTSKQVASGAAITAAHAPAAAATSISSGGWTAIIGEAAAVAAIIAIMAAFKMHEGGSVRTRRMHSGGLAADEVPIIAQEDEFMIRRDVVRQPGVLDMLMALNAGMLFHLGGGIKRMHRGGDDFGALSDPNFDPGAWADPLPGGPIFVPSDIWGKDWGAGLGLSDYGNAFFNPWISFGFLPGNIGSPGWLQGPTMIPTNFDPQGYPYAPMVNPSDPTGLMHSGQSLKPQHSGGIISKRFHMGGSIGSFPRMHSGGSLGGRLSRTGIGAASRPVVHVYPVMDRSAIIKDMSSKQGQKLIFDVIRGHRIDLGI